LVICSSFLAVPELAGDCVIGPGAGFVLGPTSIAASDAGVQYLSQHGLADVGDGDAEHAQGGSIVSAAATSAARLSLDTSRTSCRCSESAR
jgi:hypothetical protein